MDNPTKRASLIIVTDITVHIRPTHLTVSDLKKKKKFFFENSGIEPGSAKCQVNTLPLDQLELYLYILKICYVDKVDQVETEGNRGLSPTRESHFALRSHL